jgi:Fe-S-cluster containining protein
MPGMVALGDIETIIAFAEIDSPGLDRTAFLLGNFVASEGATVGKLNGDGSVSLFQIKTITPAQKPTGECVFYSQGGCAIHPVSPLGCSCCDSHMSKSEGDAVVHPALSEIQADQYADGPYHRAWIALKAAGRVARPRAERRAKFEALYAEAARRMAPRRPEPAPEA